MKTLFYIFLLASTFGLNVFEEKDMNKCCISCKAPQLKYYSIPPLNHRCGQSCLDPKDYIYYKVLEPTMKQAKTNTPCSDNGYGRYQQTEIHKAGSFAVAVDLYLKDNIKKE